MRFPVTSAHLNNIHATKPPAIIQKAEKDWRYYETTLIKMDTDKGLMLQEYKDGGTWKQHYKNWDDACVPLDISKRQADRLIAQHKLQSGTECPNVSSKKESVALKQVEKAREPQVEEPKEEEPETPAVHSADEVKQPEPKAHTNGHVVKAENGRPKQSLAAWRELGESLIGRAINRADELHRLCPNARQHAHLVSSLKTSLTILEQWHQSVQ